MIEGARRVGKSYILIDFFKVGDDIKDLFKNYKDNLDMLFTAITSRHNISPIEVKSSPRFTTSSLEKCIKKYSSHLSQAYIVHTGDLEKDGDCLYIPLYMVPCL